MPADQVTSLLSDEERAALRERVLFERSLREALKEPEKKSWFNSGLGLLVIGSLLSGLLLPVFQYTQKALENRRQSRYDTLSFTLDRRRDALKEFMLFATQTHLVVDLEGKVRRPTMAAADAQKARETIDLVRVKRQEAYANLLYSRPFFSDSSRMEAVMTGYATASATLIDAMEDLLRFRSGNDKDPTRCNKSDPNARVADKTLLMALDGAKSNLNPKYDEAELFIMRGIKEAEHVRESYWF